ncbi:FAD-dependent oxidoreductase [Alloiococcus sp. CFN-8]|uniref:FAD-dependent oxidoreductase n=1 Tax=Alloiococcus sp. CFN-8 TaxID=3416081 RepID=UPI003CF042AB
MEQLYDVIILGGGPAGLTAAVYAARAKLRALVIEKGNIGGQITITEEVVNYPGVLRTSGNALTQVIKNQAIAFGAEILSAEVLEVELEGDYKEVKTTRGDYRSLSVIAATGASPRKLGFPGEKEFQGRGVAYCATCDGQFFTGLDVFVIGGGFAAAEEAMFLTRYARRVRVIVREPDFTCAKTIADKVKAHEGIDIYFNTEIVEIGGKNTLEFACFINNETGETWEYTPPNPKETFGVFVFAGYVPATELFRDKLSLDKMGYIITDENQKTSVKGVYGAGDVCVKNLRQVVTAVADGAIAAVDLEKYIGEKYRELGLERKQLEERNQKHSKIPEGSGSEVQKLTQEDTPGGTFITSEMAAQLKPIFGKFQKSIKLITILDDKAISKELKEFLKELEPLSDKLTLQFINSGTTEAEKYSSIAKDYPALMLFTEEDEYLRVQYHGVPGGHEFNSFILALYNSAGPGQPLDEAVRDSVMSINKEVHLRVFMSLACTMCPELVMAAQRIALLNSKVKMEVFDLAHYPEYKEKYTIMSVPCFVINDEAVHFGKKSIEQLAQLLQQA